MLCSGSKLTAERARRTAVAAGRDRPGRIWASIRGGSAHRTARGIAADMGERLRVGVDRDRELRHAHASPSHSTGADVHRTTSEISDPSRHRHARRTGRGRCPRRSSEWRTVRVARTATSSTWASGPPGFSCERTRWAVTADHRLEGGSDWSPTTKCWVGTFYDVVRGYYSANGAIGQRQLGVRASAKNPTTSPLADRNADRALRSRDSHPSSQDARP